MPYSYNNGFGKSAACRCWLLTTERINQNERYFQAEPLPESYRTALTLFTMVTFQWHCQNSEGRPGGVAVTVNGTYPPHTWSEWRVMRNHILVFTTFLHDQVPSQFERSRWCNSKQMGTTETSRKLIEKGTLICFSWSRTSGLPIFAQTRSWHFSGPGSPTGTYFQPPSTGSLVWNAGTPFSPLLDQYRSKNFGGWCW